MAHMTAGAVVVVEVDVATDIASDCSSGCGKVSAAAGAVDYHKMSQRLVSLAHCHLAREAGQIGLVPGRTLQRGCRRTAESDMKGGGVMKVESAKSMIRSGVGEAEDG